ncbi:hypothetical protein M9H77_07206 [Catharanthus roseus]|uniref:Uncharacterized protein n=1 Tax=Catharanthus roseus TaxID=4058 RepID=A0ACC0BUJ1_CATRO|nr:hypothetical protein M9H77_07206 [Catharanthus roseus]
MSPQGVAEVETLEPSMIEEFSRVIHVVEETTKKEPRCIMSGKRIEDKGRSIEKELGATLEGLTISLSLNPSLMCYEVSFEKLKLFLESYLSHSTFSHVLVKLETHLGYVVNFQGLQVGTNMVHVIKDWLTSRSVFEERSFHGFTSFDKKFIKDLSTVASLLIDVPKKMIGFTWKICLPLNEFASNQVHHSPTLYSPFEVDYGYNFLIPFDMISLSIDHALNFEGKTKMDFVNSFHSKNLDIIKDNNKKF